MIETKGLDVLDGCYVDGTEPVELYTILESQMTE